MHYQCAYMDYQCANMHYQCANVHYQCEFYALSVCEFYALSVCEWPSLDPPHRPPIFFNFFFQFWTTGATFYIFFFYYTLVLLCSPLYSFLGSSLNAVVVFNLEVTHAARFALKTTAAFNEEPKRESLAWKTERL